MDTSFQGRVEVLRSIEVIAGGMAPGVVLRAQRGHGLSRLLKEIARRTADSGRPVVHATGTASLQSVPMGALSHLLAPGDLDGDNELLLLVRARTAITDLTDPVIVVDDAHLLDDLATAMILQLAHEQAGFLVLGVRAELPASADLSTLWTQGVMRRIDIGPLDASDIVAIAECELGGPLSPSLALHLSDLTEGSPARLAALIEGGREDSLLELRERGWVHTTSLASTGRIRRYMLGRLEGLPPGAMDILGALSLTSQSLPSVVIRTLDTDAVSELLGRGIVTETSEQGVNHLSVAHPIMREVVRNELSDNAIAAITTSVVDAWPRGDNDHLRRAHWLLESGAAPPAADVIELGERALAVGDSVLAAQLASRATELGGGDQALLIEAKANTFGSDPAAGEATLYQLASGSGRVAALAATHLAERRLSDGKLSEACSHLENAAARANQDDAQLLRARQSFITYLAGDTDRAHDMATSVLAVTKNGDEARDLAIVTLTAIAANRGQAESALRLASTVDPRVVRAAVAWLNAGLAMLFTGQPAQARQIADRLSEQGGPASVQSLILGWIDLEQGTYERAAQRFEQTISTLPVLGTVGLIAKSTAVMALAHAQAGNESAARAALHDLSEMAIAPRELSDGLRRRCLGWLAHSRAEGCEATDWFLAAADAHRRAGQPMFECLAWYDLVRIGQVDRSSEALRELADQCGGAAVPALYAEHARAIRDQDGPAVLGLAERFERAGRLRYAAEAASGGARMISARESQIDIAEEDDRLLGPPARPPSGLTRREIEVARLAARNVSSRDIAAALHLSSRTVDNHLHRVYRKLDIHGRGELTAELLDG
ncbi:MAG: LuxR C-terminal-related transcriptional regulator [Acidimicrobiia bacterium]|nr:LuxR C-terminal-related transcriptional regulator [Acidimicrobiia bacterium]